MPRVQFYYHEKGNHDETWHYLCKDQHGRAYVETERSAGDPKRGSMEVGAPACRTIQEFLESGQGSAQNDLLSLIATLVPDDT
jgi:hypothetical protein